jgi:uncharacterized protein YuzE
MRITYDPEADMAYIRLQDPIEPGSAVRQESVLESFIFDFDYEGRLLGIEVFDASRTLTKGALASAVRPGSTGQEDGPPPA